MNYNPRKRREVSWIKYFVFIICIYYYYLNLMIFTEVSKKNKVKGP